MATTSVPTPRRTASIVLAGVTAALPLVLALFAPAEIVLPLALVLPFGTMIWLEGARPALETRRISMAPARCSMA
jgi:hypothetical protein